MSFIAPRITPVNVLPRGRNRRDDGFMPIDTHIKFHERIEQVGDVLESSSDGASSRDDRLEISAAAVKFARCAKDSLRAFGRCA